MPAHVHVILNPRSAGGKGARVLGRLPGRLTEAGFEHDLHVTRAPGHARALAAGLPDEPGVRVLVVGGDGTLHEAVNGLIDRGEPLPPVAVLPVGTGNDFFRMVRSGPGIEEALAALRVETPRYFDLGQVRWQGSASEVFVNLAGVGLDVEVLRRRARFRRVPGLLQYLCALGTALVGFRRPSVVVRFDTPGAESRELSGETLLTAVTVGPSVAGGIRLAPDARADDGALDLFMVEGLGVPAVARYLPSIFRGTHSNVPNIHMHRIRNLRIEDREGRDLHFELDGELMPEASPWIEIDILPGVLPVLETGAGS